MLSDDIRKILMAGMGAVATATEKSIEFVDDLAKKTEDMPERCRTAMEELSQKGEAAFQQSKAFGNDLKNRVKEAIDGLNLDLESMLNSLDSLSDADLETLLQRIEELRAQRAEAAQQNPTDNSTNE